MAGEFTEEMTADVMRRLNTVERRIDKIEDQIAQYGIADATLTVELKSLRADFAELKEEVLTTVKEQTSKTWKLIEKLWTIIIVLISSLLLVAGVKIAPDLLKSLL